MQSITVIAAAPSTQSVKLTANLFAGTNSPALMTGGYRVASIVQSDNLTSAASYIPGADDIASPSFWPTGSLLSRIELPGVADAAYATQAPRPMVLRPILGTTRFKGALQAKP